MGANYYTQMAVAMRWAEGCRYLLQHDFRHKFQEEYADLLTVTNQKLQY